MRIADGHATPSVTLHASYSASTRGLPSLANTIDEAGAQLANARTVHDLDQVAMMINAHKYAIDDAVKSHDDARAAAELTAGKLRERARQLATAERIVEIAVRTRSDHEARQEQRASDDIGGRTRR